MRSTVFSSIVIALFLAACQPPAESESRLVVNEVVKARIDSVLKGVVESSQVAGVSALIYEKDKEVYFNAFGFADREKNMAMDRQTIVRIYSMTKPVTGVALMKLFERGAFQLDDPISKYAPEFSNMKVFAGLDKSGKPTTEPVRREITIRDITRHTAGFAREDHPVLGAQLKAIHPFHNVNQTLSEFATRLSTLPLAFHPGEEWSYGVCVDVQAFLVERISGQPFDQFVQQQILDPLNMRETRYVVPSEDMSRFAALYSKGETGLQRVHDSIASKFHTNDWPMNPGGYGFTSTLDDYMKFARMLVNEGKAGDTSILREETVRLMATNHLADSVTERMWLPSKGQVGFGIDFAVRMRPPASAEESNGVVGEFFWDGAASTLFWVDPANELTALLFVQIFPFDRVLHKQFRDAVYGSYQSPVVNASK